MRPLFLVLFCTVLAVCASGSAPDFDPNGYQLPDGALSLHYRGDYIEPYFATKALLLAEDAGLDVREPVEKWIAWLLPRQEKDGSFGRYCRKPGQDWRRCAEADADDSMLALWLQLLYTNAPDSGLPPAWRASVERAENSLDALRNSRLGVYHVSRQNHVALLMDNVEVYAALAAIARAQQRFGQAERSRATQEKAETLDSAIQRVFWNKHEEWFRPSIQKNRPEFYPDVVAQVYPWLADMPVDSKIGNESAWQSWKSRFATEWLDKKLDPHPWGLVAMAALKFDDIDSASCWLSRAEPLRFSSDWNVLEEAAFQAIQTKVGQAGETNPLACSKVSAAP
jgi:hypothetical protein